MNISSKLTSFLTTATPDSTPAVATDAGVTPAPSTTRSAQGNTVDAFDGGTAQASVLPSLPQLSVSGPTISAAALRTQGAAALASVEPKTNKAPDGTPFLKQTDPRWGMTRIGHSEKQTLGQVGCLLTSVSMTLSQKLGREVRPDELNETLKKGGGFSQDVLFDYLGAKKAIKETYGVELPLEGRAKNISGADIASFVDGELKAGRQAIIHVDTNPATDTMQAPNHYVLVNRKVGDEYVIIDPAMGDERRYKLDKDGNFAASESYYPQFIDKKWTYDRPIAHGYIMSSALPPAPKAK